MSGDELRDLYQDVIIDHGKRPRNFRKLEDATCTAEGFNPLCGDQLRIYLKLADGVIEDIGFQGVGCAISQASASLMTLAVKGQKPEEALALFARVHTLLTEGPNGRVTPGELGKLAVLSGVWEFPVRVKCATLAWHTLRSALEGSARQVTTE
ncbi:Fe-S cluster assembly sulfur transfer protein SufU [Pseudomonas fluorescens]|uniref:Iron-sulfur cluster assembly scaffold protein IscU n=1 Tax=Pseudomonas fluorescens TaxID=294 RepID=A0A5E7C6P7_PSEFL|nr:SUF system NifU family Fe-S cluster assembly protein [Pseudomonas fluorescens]VVO00260.1 Iron-sulfur cluster assembly scaffold protein IscU [Pseudomonas fluorescens]